jgi:uncharacterized membrane protein YkvI
MALLQKMLQFPIFQKNLKLIHYNALVLMEQDVEDVHQVSQFIVPMAILLMIADFAVVLLQCQYAFQMEDAQPLQQ